MRSDVPPTKSRPAEALVWERGAQDVSPDDVALGDVSQIGHLERLASVGLLMTGIAHNLSNLLLPVVGACDAARLQDDPDVHARAVGTSYEYGRRAAELLRVLMAFARRDQPQPVAVDVEPVVEDALLLLRHEIRTADVAVVRRFEGTHTAMIDRTRLLQATLNVLANAVRAAAQGGHTVTVTVAGERDRVRIDVADDGPGIPEALRPHLFRPFVHEDEGEGGNPDSRQHTGLGLFIARRLVSEHGGDIRFASRLGHGTTFRLEARAARPPSCSGEVT